MLMYIDYNRVALLSYMTEDRSKDFIERFKWVHEYEPSATAKKLNLPKWKSSMMNPINDPDFNNIN